MITRVEYLVGDNIQEILRSTLYNLYNGKVEFKGPDPNIEVIAETGLGGMMKLDESLKEMIVNSGLVINASDMGNITGVKREGFYTSYTIPFLANVKFKLNPDFDPIDDNDIDNPFINGFRRSSYNYKLSYTINGIEDTVEIVAVGMKPVFRGELRGIIDLCNLEKEYGISSDKLVKYIMNCLNNLK